MTLATPEMVKVQPPASMTIRSLTAGFHPLDGPACGLTLLPLRTRGRSNILSGSPLGGDVAKSPRYGLVA